MTYESKGVYERIARDQAAILSWAINGDTRHGTRAYCPRCHRWGIFDLTHEYSFPKENSIYYSTVYDRWECAECVVHSPG